MARAPILQLSDISLTLGGPPMFDGVDLVIQPGDRLALVGRNGSGKSTLMRIMAGLTEPDRGARVLGPGLDIGYMEQDPDLSGFATLGDFATQGLEPGQLYKVERAGEGLGFDPGRPVATASGGERRRAALARLLAGDPGLLLLDEPTNHLDITAIEWLEDELKHARAASVVISHDRRFLDQLTRATLWLDRGIIRRKEVGFGGFEAWRDQVWDEEDLARHKMDRKIKAEARWAVEGISARRKRNQGRVRALQDLRGERAAMIRRQGTAAMALEEGPKSGKKVIEISGISKAYGDKLICRNLSLTVQRGDRIALIGPNGAGKTTLLRLMLGDEAPDSGTVRLGTNLVPAVFDQTRAALDPDATLWESLTGDPDMRVSGRADQVMVRGQPKHVVGYLKDFLFDEAQARAPVRALSGGEKARLLLARLMAQASNVLVLDEPTNDLDVETLDLLQELLDGYDGTVLLVSHDRDFIDRVATLSLVLDGCGNVTPFAGGWTDVLAQGGAPRPADDRRPAPAPAAPKPARQNKSGGRKNGLSFTEKHRLEALPAEMDRLGAEIAKLEALLGDATLFSREPVKFRKATEALVERQKKLSAAEEEWLILAEKAEQE